MAKQPQSWTDFQAQLKKQHQGETSWNPFGKRKQGAPTSPIIAAGRGPVAGNAPYRALPQNNSGRITSPSAEWNANRPPAPYFPALRQPGSGIDLSPESFQYSGPDYASILSSISSSTVDPYNNRLAELRNQRGTAQGQIANGSQDLAAKLAESRAALDAKYSQALAATQAQQAAAQQALQQGQLSSAAQSAQLAKNLGIDAVDTSKANEIAAQSGQDLNQYAQAANSALTADQLAQYTLGTRNSDMALAKGREDQSASGRNFDSAIASLLDQQAQASNSARSQADSQYRDARDFAYQEWLRQHNEGRQDAQSQLDFENQMALKSAGQQYQPSPFEALTSTLQFRNPNSLNAFTSRLGQYNERANGSEPGSFQSLFGNLSPGNQAAFRAYLKAVGLA